MATSETSITFSLPLEYYSLPSPCPCNTFHQDILFIFLWSNDPNILRWWGAIIWGHLSHLPHSYFSFIRCFQQKSKSTHLRFLLSNYIKFIFTFNSSLPLNAVPSHNFLFYNHRSVFPSLLILFKIFWDRTRPISDISKQCLKTHLLSIHFQMLYWFLPLLASKPEDPTWKHFILSILQHWGMGSKNFLP